MSLTIAAIQSGTEPKGPLPPGAFHRTLEEQLTCPKCSVTYNLIADYDESMGRFFEQESYKPILLLKKTIQRGHDHNHQLTHLETNGVVVRAIGEVMELPKPKLEEVPLDGWTYHPRHAK
jgi:hypothetical protein